MTHRPESSFSTDAVVEQGTQPATEDWQVRLAAAIAVHKRRMALRAFARGEFAEARAYGLVQRHRQKLRHIRAAQSATEKEEPAP